MPDQTTRIAATKTYRVTVRIVPYNDAVSNVRVDVRATNSHSARAKAERVISADYPNARAIVGISQRRITD